MDLVFLHGVAAAGKLTVARALGARLQYGVFHNHLVVDALTAVFTFGTSPFVKLREDFWLATFREAAASDTSLIFTFAPEPTVTAGFPERARRAVEDGGGRIHFVRLSVGESEQERRIGLPSRHEFGKLTDVQTLRRLRELHGDVEHPPTDLLVDTEHSSPEETAGTIVRAFGLEPSAEHHRYPIG
jgi:chloramphenicol 3-O-phosphotransferase